MNRHNRRFSFRHTQLKALMYTPYWLVNLVLDLILFGWALFGWSVWLEMFHFFELTNQIGDEDGNFRLVALILIGHLGSTLLLYYLIRFRRPLSSNTKKTTSLKQEVQPSLTDENEQKSAGAISAIGHNAPKGYYQVLFEKWFPKEDVQIERSEKTPPTSETKENASKAQGIPVSLRQIETDDHNKSFGSNKSLASTFRRIQSQLFGVNVTPPTPTVNSVSIDKKAGEEIRSAVKLKPISTIGKIPWAQLHERKAEIGTIGELIALELEKSRLNNQGQSDLAWRVEHVSATRGDGLGYDILSFRADGATLYVEVKTTTSKAPNVFFLTKREKECMNQHPEHYAILFIYALDTASKSYDYEMHIGKSAIESLFDFIPEEFKMKLN